VFVDVVNTDLMSGLDKGLHHSVDILLFNPPYVPTPQEEVGTYGIAASWAGGEDGRVVIDRFLPLLEVTLTLTLTLILTLTLTDVYVVMVMVMVMVIISIFSNRDDEIVVMITK
jgi:methylase of polypeptide subunit release factors